MYKTQLKMDQGLSWNIWSFETARGKHSKIGKRKNFLSRTPKVQEMIARIDKWYYKTSDNKTTTTVRIKIELPCMTHLYHSWVYTQKESKLANDRDPCTHSYYSTI
jgi:hypothetical protein